MRGRCRDYTASQFSNRFSLPPYNSFRKTFTLQHGQSDCGVACLASVIKYHGGVATIERLRELSGTSRQGTTLLGLYQAAQQSGFNVEGLEAENIDNLNDLSVPAILHVIIDSKLQHYFVFYGFDKTGKLIIGDPAKGILHYTKEDLEKVWQSKALLKLTPNSNFVKRKSENAEKKKWIIALVKDDVNILLAALFLGILMTVLGLSTAIFSQKLIDDILPSGNTQKLILSILLLTFLLLARSGMGFLRGFFLIRQAKDFNNRIIQRFYGSLLRLQKSFFDSRKTGELIARMNDARRIQTVISIISGSIIIDFLLMMTSVVFVFLYSSTVGFVVLSGIPVYLLWVYFFNSKIIDAQKEVMRGYAHTEGHYVDTIQGIATIKASNKETFFENVNKQVYGFFQDKVVELGKVNIRFGVVSEITGVIFITLVFGVSSWMVLKETLQLGQMVALLSIAGGVIPALGRLAIANVHLQEARVAFDRMYEFVSLKPEAQHDEDQKPDPPEIESLTLQNVTFRFPGRKQLLTGVTMEVRRGEMVAILGESGGGKSTLVQILQKFYWPESGSIYLNDINLNNLDAQQWRSMIGVVPQEVKIFNGNLLYNLTLSQSPEEFEVVIKFCHQYGFDKYFQSFPQSYLTILGEEGVNISGGQKQLVALARALFKKPKLLLLDEATAAMDKNTENFVLQLLLRLKAEIPVLLVTHRIKTAQKADRIYILEAGRVSHCGKPEDLMASDNFFSEAVREVAV